MTALAHTRGNQTQRHPYMKSKTLVIAAWAAAVLTGCASSTGSPAHDAPAGPATATSTTVAKSACDTIGGTVGPDQTCHLDSDNARYTLDFRFPVDYPDQQALADLVTQRRDGFVDWVGDMPPSSVAYALHMIGEAFHSGTPASGTQSLVFTIGTDGGVHPVTTYEALNFDLSKHVPITFDTLFQPGTRPLEVLNPIVQRELDKRGATGSLSLDDLGVKAYQNFAITDGAVIFFFNQDGVLPHENGSLEVQVPRTEIASLLA
jgi:hypothetical protein